MLAAELQVFSVERTKGILGQNVGKDQHCVYCTQPTTS